MLTIARRKIIPLIILLLMTLMYFLPELTMFSRYLGNEISRAVNNTKYYIELVSPGHSEYNFPEKPVIVYKTNLEQEKLDLAKSTISVFSQEYGRYTFNFQTEHFKFEEKDGLTYITYTQKEAIPYYYTTYIDFEVIDTDGGQYYSNIYSTRTDNFFDYFISRHSFYLQYLIWFFAIFGTSIKGIPWTIVYDSKTKQPVSAAIVRIFKDGRLYNTLISDVNGVVRIHFDKGDYKMQVLKEGYIFPSILKPLKQDGEYADLYYGQVIKVTAQSQVLKCGIPIDSTSINREGITRGLVSATVSNLVLLNPYFIAIVTILQVVVWPDYIYSWFTLVVATILIVLQYLLVKKTYGTPGRVIDEMAVPVPGIKVVLYEADWNKAVTYQITDERGEYEFVVPRKKYYIKIENPDFVLVDADDEGKLFIDEPPNGKKTMRINDRIVVKRSGTK